MYLGHFTSLRSLELILKSKKFRFNTLDNTNDPFENKNLIYKIGINYQGGKFVTLSDVVVKENLKKYFQVLCFCLEPDIDKLIKKPKMWQYYADSHSGCCIVLNKEKVDTDFCKIKNEEMLIDFKKVRYNLEKQKDVIESHFKDMESVLSKNGNRRSAITDFIWKNRRIYIFSKMKDWKTENEYRYAIYNKDNEIKITSMDISTSIEEIVLGENVTDVYEEMIYDRFQDQKIKISKLEWINGYPLKKVVSDRKDREKCPSVEELKQNQLYEAIKMREIK